MSKIIIKKEKEQKILNFYPNVYKDEIKNIVGEVKTEDIVDVITSDMTSGTTQHHAFPLRSTS